MKKIYLLAGILMISARAHAGQMWGNYHVWKSSWLPSANYTTMLTSAPIVFHLATGSTTANAGFGNFSILQSSNETFGSGPDMSTRAFYTSDVTQVISSNLGSIYDVTVTSHAFILKSGGGSIQYLWDWVSPPGYKTPYDGN